MSITAAARRLKPEELRAVCEPAALGFASTAALPPLDGMIGQARALAATTFGIRMRHRGSNLFALGPAVEQTLARNVERLRQLRAEAPAAGKEAGA
jgi:hypothetical protein